MDSNSEIRAEFIILYSILNLWRNSATKSSKLPKCRVQCWLIVAVLWSSENDTAPSYAGLSLSVPISPPQQVHSYPSPSASVFSAGCQKQQGLKPEVGNKRLGYLWILIFLRAGHWGSNCRKLCSCHALNACSCDVVTCHHAHTLPALHFSKHIHLIEFGNVLGRVRVFWVAEVQLQ